MDDRDPQVRFTTWKSLFGVLLELVFVSSTVTNDADSTILWGPIIKPLVNAICTSRVISFPFSQTISTWKIYRAIELCYIRK